MKYLERRGKTIFDVGVKLKLMYEIQPREDEPLIRVFANQEEMHEATGHKILHGFFDPKKNVIFATIESVPHEIGHFRDLRSGGMKNPREAPNPELRRSWKIRNEIVAILFAFTKLGEAGTSLPYEAEFIKWVRYLKSHENNFPFKEQNLKEWKFEEIQKIADWISHVETPWFDRLEYLFATYLSEEHMVLTYSLLRKKL